MSNEQKLKDRIAELENALQRIERWFGEFPETGKYWDAEQTRPMSFAACWGSNGERDFMRRIASDALQENHKEFVYRGDKI